MDNLGLQLKKYRELRRLTQKELGEKISKSVSAVSSYETNIQPPPLDVLISIARVLNVTLDTLVGFDRAGCYSVNGLSQEKQDLINDLFAELSNPTNSPNGELSSQQMEIIRKLMVIFSSGNTNMQ